MNQMLWEQQDSATMAHALDEGRVVSRLEKVPHKGGSGDGIDDNVEGRWRKTVRGAVHENCCVRMWVWWVGGIQSVRWCTSYISARRFYIASRRTYHQYAWLPQSRGRDADALILDQS